jgi:hypothetical protein
VAVAVAVAVGIIIIIFIMKINEKLIPKTSKNTPKIPFKNTVKCAKIRFECDQIVEFLGASVLFYI